MGPKRRRSGKQAGEVDATKLKAALASFIRVQDRGRKGDSGLFAR